MEQQPIKKDYYLFIGTFFVLLLLTIFLPFLPIMLILLPIPLILIIQKYNNNWIILAMAIMGLLSFFLFPVLTIPLTIIALISGAMIGFSIKWKHHPYETWANGTVGYVLGIAIVYAYVELVLDISIMNALTGTIDESIAMTERLFEAVGMQSQLDLTTLENDLMLFLQLTPVILVVISMTLSIISQWLSYKWMNKKEKADLYFPVFRSFKLPKIMLWIYFIALLATFFVERDLSTTSSVVINNLFHLLGLLMALQGVSFVFFFCYQKRVSIALPIITIIFIVLLPAFGLYLARILGIIDLGFEMRKRMAK